MFISGCNKFIFMFDNFREDARQTLLNYLLPRGISRPDWWPSTDSKWWVQLGFPTHKGELPFELDSSKLSKVWKVAVLVGIIQHHSPRVICNAFRLDEKMKTVMLEKEKLILSAAFTIFDWTFSSESNEDAGSTTATCKEHVVLALAAPQNEKNLLLLGVAAQIQFTAPVADVNRPDDAIELRSISKRNRAKTAEKEPLPIAAAMCAILISSQAPAGDVDQPDDVGDQRNISDSGKSSSEFHNTSENAAEEETCLKKKAELNEDPEERNPQLWVEASGGQIKGRAPYIDTSSLHSKNGTKSEMQIQEGLLGEKAPNPGWVAPPPPPHLPNRFQLKAALNHPSIGRL